MESTAENQPLYRTSWLLAHKISHVHYEPLGVVAAIVSWNYVSPDTVVLAMTSEQKSDVFFALAFSQPLLTRLGSSHVRECHCRQDKRKRLLV